MGYTAAEAFFEALTEAGITHCFVNLGSDHPALLEAYAQGREKDKTFPRFITCPNEMVALSMADGYARLTGKPQCVIVHVDVGTQALAAAVHDASTGRSPVLIFAGISPITLEGETRGSRTEFIHWMQDVKDQKQIVEQYCRYTAEIKTGKNIKQMVNRALSFAMSDPKGPVYLIAAREVLEEEIQPYQLQQKFWNPVEPCALPVAGVELLSKALVDAKEPLIITGYSGRNHAAVGELVKLANTVRGLRVLDTSGSDMCFPASHPGWLGLKYGNDESIRTADTIICLDVDVPWIPTLCKPSDSCVVFHIDVDPLKQLMPVFYINAVSRFCADSYTALSQLNQYLEQSDELQSKLKDTSFQDRWKSLQASYQGRLSRLASLASPASNDTYKVPYLISRLRNACPPDTIWVIESVTNALNVQDQVQATIPGSYLNCGGGGLGWSGGAALGVKLASTHSDWLKKPKFDTTTQVNGDQSVGKPSFVCQVVGDGTFLFSVPSSVYWISARYQIPVLTVILNNCGWNAPKNSLLLVHPEGAGSKLSPEELHISFAPTPDYAGIAKAASGDIAWAGRTSKASELDELLQEAVAAVKDGRSAVFDAHLDGPQGKYTGK